MKSKKIVVWIIVIAFLCTLTLSAKRSVEVCWVSFMNFINPQYYEIKLKEWSSKPTDFLIGKLGHPAPSWDGVAGNILASRKGIGKESQLVTIIESSSNTAKRSSALGVLFFWNDERAKEISMKILESGKTHPLYDSALGKLAYRQYEPAYLYVVDLAKSPERYTNGSVSLIEKYGKLEALPILGEMLANANTTLDERVITNAIQSIKAKNGMK